MKSRKAWVFQRGGSWYELDGSRKTKSFGKTKTKANQFAAKKGGELVDGVSDGDSAKPRQTLKDAYAEQILALKRPGTRVVYQTAIEHYERVCKPSLSSDLTTESVLFLLVLGVILVDGARIASFEKESLWRTAFRIGTRL